MISPVYDCMYNSGFWNRLLLGTEVIRSKLEVLSNTTYGTDQNRAAPRDPLHPSPPPASHSLAAQEKMLGESLQEPAGRPKRLLENQGLDKLRKHHPTSLFSICPQDHNLHYKFFLSPEEFQCNRNGTQKLQDSHKDIMPSKIISKVGEKKPLYPLV